ETVQLARGFDERLIELAHRDRMARGCNTGLMKVEVVGRVPSTLPADDTHPYRTGAWTPNVVEYDATDLDVVAGAIPDDLNGVYLRNTENPVHDAIGLY